MQPRKKEIKIYRPGVAGSNPAGGWISFCFLTSLSSLSDLHFISSVSIIRSLWEVRLGKGSRAALCEKGCRLRTQGIKRNSRTGPDPAKNFQHNLRSIDFWFAKNLKRKFQVKIWRSKIQRNSTLTIAYRIDSRPTSVGLTRSLTSSTGADPHSSATALGSAPASSMQRTKSWSP